MLPFTVAQFFAVFGAYNTAVWPAPVAAYLLAALGLGTTMFRPAVSGRVVPTVLAVLWIWTGVAYHWVHLAPVNPAARLFAAAFVLEGLLLLRAGMGRAPILFAVGPDWRRVFGLALVAYAILYPLLGVWAGHAYPEAPTFGITPCPLTLFTFGMLLLALEPVPLRLLPIPALWSLVGGSAAVLLDVPQDWMLLAGGILATVVLVGRYMGGRRGTVARR
ncbi:MAG TPA: DUF6064 family protein [Azospirillum sp.]|nr:DUF6064 family protein [Azospirillum sp.]